MSNNVTTPDALEPAETLASTFGTGPALGEVHESVARTD